MNYDGQIEDDIAFESEAAYNDSDPSDYEDENSGEVEDFEESIEEEIEPQDEEFEGNDFFDKPVNFTVAGEVEGTEKNINDKPNEPGIEALRLKEETDIEIVELDDEAEEEETERSIFSRLLKPDGVHYNKVVLILLVLGVVGTILGSQLLFGSDGKKKKKGEDAAKVEETTVQADKMPPVLEEKDIVKSQVGNSSEVNLTANSNSNTSLLGADSNSNTDAKMIQNASTLNGNPPPPANLNLQPSTTTTTTQTYSEAPPSSSGSGSSGSNPSPNRVNNRQTQNSDYGTTEGGAIVMRKGKRIEDTSNYERVNSYNEKNSKNETTAENAETRFVKLPRGTRIILQLRDPVRSGIETTVQAVSVDRITDSTGKTIIEPETVFELIFNPQEINARVFAQELMRVNLPDGEAYLKASVKGGDGFEGLTGKVKKQGGTSLTKKIIGGVARVGTGMIPQFPGSSDINSEINERTSNDRISYSDKIVEIPAGTRFLLITK